MCLAVVPTVDRDWEIARNEIETTLQKVSQCCIAREVPDATLEANFLSVGFGSVSPEACGQLTVVKVNTDVYWSFDDGATWLMVFDSGASPATGMGTGTVTAFTSAIGSIPANWLACDGQAVSRTTYAALFAIIGTTYGVGDGSTTFNLPDMRARSPMGSNHVGLPNGSDGAYSTRNRADGVGVELHPLALSELPAHEHSDNTGVNGNRETGGSTIYRDGSIDTGTTGSDTAHNNIAPMLVMYYAIRT